MDARADGGGYLSEVCLEQALISVMGYSQFKNGEISVPTCIGRGISRLGIYHLTSAYWSSSYLSK